MSSHLQNQEHGHCWSLLIGTTLVIPLERHGLDPGEFCPQGALIIGVDQETIVQPKNLQDRASLKDSRQFSHGEVNVFKFKGMQLQQRWLFYNTSELFAEDPEARYKSKGSQQGRPANSRAVFSYEWMREWWCEVEFIIQYTDDTLIIMPVEP